MEDDMTDVLAQAYPWILSIHIISVISWMAGIFYLPRLFVHHSEVRGGYLREGENVEFELGEGQKGPCAVSVHTAS